MEEALPGFSREEQAALQWVLKKKEREPTKVCVCAVCLSLVVDGLSLFSVFDI